MFYRQPKPEEVLAACERMWKMSTEDAFTRSRPSFKEMTYRQKAFRTCYVAIMSRATCWSAKNIADECGMNHTMAVRARHAHDDMMERHPMYAMSFDLTIDATLRIMRQNDLTASKREKLTESTG